MWREPTLHDLSRVQLEEASIAPSQERTPAVLFCDIREFTRFVDKSLAYDVVHILNRLFKVIGDAILINNGVIYQYAGDQIIGLFSHMLQFLVYALSRPETMMLGLRDLGRRHDGYGVSSEYYPIFRRVFLESAREILGDKHTPQVEKAWADTIDMVIRSMGDTVAVPTSDR